MAKDLEYEGGKAGAVWPANPLTARGAGGNLKQSGS